MPPNKTSTSDYECKAFFYSQNLVPILYFLMFPVSLLLNGVAAWVSLYLKSTSTFMVYLKNIIAADIIMTLIMPIDATSKIMVHSKLVLVLSCYISPIFYSTQYTCITLLGLISLDRFSKIMMPGRLSLVQNLTFSKVLSCLVWVTLFCFTALPNIILSNKPIVKLTEISTCMNLKDTNGLEFHGNIIIYLNVYFWLMSLVITICYICITKKVIQSYLNSGSKNDQGKQKIKLRVFLVVIVFFLSFGPYHLIRIPYTFLQVNVSDESTCTYVISRFVKEFSLWFATTNICMNPLLYIFLCREFKDKLVSGIEKLLVSYGLDPECASGQCQLISV